MSVKERLERVQYRSMQADSALKQLETCIDVINSKRTQGVTDIGLDKVRELEEENQRLQKEADLLKEKLIKLELLNGVSQVPVTTAKEPEAIAVEAKPQNNPVPNGQPPRANSEPKKEKKEKVASKGGAAAKPSATKGKASDKPLDVSRLDMRIGRILSVKKHPEADTLYVEEIDVGESVPRTVCSGLVEHIAIDQMENRMVVAMCNLKPAKMRGVVSQAMVMCASSPDKVEILDPPSGAIPGDRVTVEGYAGTPDEQLNPKKKIFEQVQPDLNTNEEGVACYKGVPWTVPGKGFMKSQTMKNSPIK